MYFAWFISIFSEAVVTFYVMNVCIYPPIFQLKNMLIGIVPSVRYNLTSGVN